MSAWTGKPCDMCKGKKGPKYADSKYCGHCKFKNKKERARAAHSARLEKTYGIDREDYDNCKAYQGGMSFLDRRSTGKTRRLSVDHDHHHAEKQVRGLLSRPDNNQLGLARDSIAYFLRGIIYLVDPPFQRMLRGDPAVPIDEGEMEFDVLLARVTGLVKQYLGR